MSKNKKSFRCSFCNKILYDYCQDCINAFSSRLDPNKMTGDERAAEMNKLRGPVSIPFTLMHQRIEELVGRPVFTHEMGANWDKLVEEVKIRKAPTLEELINLIPIEKRIIVIGGK